MIIFTQIMYVMDLFVSVESLKPKTWVNSCVFLSFWIVLCTIKVTE